MHELPGLLLSRANLERIEYLPDQSEDVAAPTSHTIACGSREGRQQQGHSHREPAPTEVGREHLRPEQLAGSAGGETAADGAKGANDEEAPQSAIGQKDAKVAEVAKGGRDAMSTKGLGI